MNIRLSIGWKMILFLIPTALIVFGGAIGFLGFHDRNRIVDDYKRIADLTAEKISNEICIKLLTKATTNEDELAGVEESLVFGDNEKKIAAEWLNNIEITKGNFGFLLAKNGDFIIAEKKNSDGVNLANTLLSNVDINELTNLVQQSESFTTNFNKKSEKFYVSHTPLVIGKTISGWNVVICTPIQSINESANKTIMLALIICLLAVLLTGIAIFFYSRSITNPLKDANKLLEKLSKGDIDKDDKLLINTGDEIEDIALAVNNLIDGLNSTADFALTIGKGDYKAQYQKSSENDVLGNALLEMRESLLVAEEEEKKRKIEDKKLNWATQGLAKFGEILRQHNQDIEDLSFSIMSNLVDYVQAIQGGIFVKNEDNEDDNDEVEFELTGAVAYDRKKLLDRKFKIGESLIGRCAYEKLTIYMEDIPDNYVNVTSGLGEANPRALLIVPAILNDEVYAIIELVSFNKFEEHEIKFVEKIGESIASTIANARVNSRTNKLLEQSKQQSEELAAQEEEMRQNLEELQATQEEVSRLRIEEQQKNQEMIDQVEKYKTALLRILDYIPIKIFLKDNKGKMLIVNKKVLEVHSAKPEDLLGKSDFDFIEDQAVAKKLWDAEQAIIKSGKPFKERQIETINNTGMILDTTKSPFYIDYLDETGILGVQLDITELVNQEETIKKLKEEIKKIKK